jgi:hypothetical protein
MTAGAMALANNMTFWGQVDGMTSGFFNFYPLVWFNALFSQPFDYTSSRLVGILLMAGSLVFFFLAVRNLFQTKTALIALLFVSAFMGAFASVELLHYSSEYVSVFIINVLCWQFSCIYKQPKSSFWLLFALGFVASCTIFAKLQATPIAFGCVLMSMVVLIIQNYKNSVLQCLKYIGTVCLGSVFYFSVLVLVTLYNGVFDDMISLYFINNFGYGLAGNGSLFSITYFYETLFYDFDYMIILKGLVAFSILFLSFESVKYLIKKEQCLPKIPVLFVFVLILFSIFSVYKTKYVFGHYLNFLIFPTGFVFVLLLASFEKTVSNTFNCIAITAIALGILVANGHYPLTTVFISAGQPIRPLALSATSTAILKYTKANEPLAVWGNGSRFHLETKLVQATRWNFTLWSPYSKSQKEFMYQEYLKDMKQTKVPVFVDSYPNTERACHGHEIVPQIRTWIEENYTKVADIDQSRIYVRNDRYESLNDTNVR